MNAHVVTQVLVWEHAGSLRYVITTLINVSDNRLAML